MSEKNLMWECSDCGQVEYADNPPPECEKCWKLNSYIKVAEDDIDAKREENLVEGIRKDFDDEEEDDP